MKISPLADTEVLVLNRTEYNAVRRYNWTCRILAGIFIVLGAVAAIGINEANAQYNGSSVYFGSSNYYNSFSNPHPMAGQEIEIKSNDFRYDVKGEIQRDGSVYISQFERDKVRMNTSGDR